MAQLNGVEYSNASQILRIMRRCSDRENRKLFGELVKLDSMKLNALLKAKLITDDLISFATNLEGEDSLVIIERVIKLLNYGFPLCPETIEVSKSLKKLDILFEAKDFVGMQEVFAFFKPEFSVGQFAEILKGFQQGVHPNRIRFYASSEYDARQMREIRKGFRNGVEDRFILFIAKFKDSAECMREIRKGFENGLSKYEVLIYAQNFFDAAQMRHIRRVLEQGFSDECVCFIASPEYTATEMSYICEGFESGLSIEQVESYIHLPQKQLKERLVALQKVELKKII